jgi:hypothetical protein
MVTSERIIASIKNFDALPDDVLVPPRVASLILGISERRLRSDPPIIPRIPVSAQRSNFRVGDIRKVARGQTALAPA